MDSRALHLTCENSEFTFQEQSLEAMTQEQVKELVRHIAETKGCLALQFKPVNEVATCENKG